MSLWYQLVRLYVGLGVKLYFRKVQVVGASNVPAKGPVMFTVNHQNAFLDALLVATSNQRHTHFLARADVFKFKLIRRFFASLNMMPVYRMRDGRRSLTNNHQIFEKCFEILKEEHALMLFPEANHHQKRLLLPLSKGFTRIALGMDSAIHIVPVGINYTHHRFFGGSVSIHYGKPLSTQSYLNENPQSSRVLRKEVNDRMEKLITHIPDSHQYQRIENYLNLTPSVYMDPTQCNQWLQQVTPENLPIIKAPAKKARLRQWAKLISYLLNYPPLALSDMALGKLADPVFSSSIKFITAIMILPIYYLLLVVMVGLIWGNVFAAGVIFLCVLSLLCRKWSLRY